MATLDCNIIYGCTYDYVDMTGWLGLALETLVYMGLRSCGLGGSSSSFVAFGLFACPFWVSLWFTSRDTIASSRLARAAREICFSRPCWVKLRSLFCALYLALWSCPILAFSSAIFFQPLSGLYFQHGGYSGAWYCLWVFVRMDNLNIVRRVKCKMLLSLLHTLSPSCVCPSVTARLRSRDRRGPPRSVVTIGAGLHSPHAAPS